MGARELAADRDRREEERRDPPREQRPLQAGHDAITTQEQLCSKLNKLCSKLKILCSKLKKLCSKFRCPVDRDRGEEERRDPPREQRPLQGGHDAITTHKKRCGK